MTKLEKLLNEYFVKFGEDYPLMITANLTESEIITDIKNCIKMNKVADKPVYDDDLIY